MQEPNIFEHMSKYGIRLGGVFGGLYYSINVLLRSTWVSFGFDGVEYVEPSNTLTFDAVTALIAFVLGGVIGLSMGFIFGILDALIIRAVLRQYGFPIPKIIILKKRWLVYLIAIAISGGGTNVSLSWLINWPNIIIPLIAASVGAAFAAHRYLILMCHLEN